MASGRKHPNPLLRAAIALALAQGALVQPAQGQATDTKKEEVTAVDKVVVTARRREELLQDVPGAVSVFSGESIEKSGIPDITGIADLTPNTTLKTSRATNSTLTAFIRGIGQQDPVAGYEQGVGIYIDDVYLARPQGALADIYDLERIEVLRGPQGTLYGRNTIGGAIKYVTRRLGAKPELNVKADDRRLQRAQPGRQGKRAGHRHRAPGRDRGHVQPGRIRQECRERHRELQQGSPGGAHQRGVHAVERALHPLRRRSHGRRLASPGRGIA